MKDEVYEKKRELIKFFLKNDCQTTIKYYISSQFEISEIDRLKRDMNNEIINKIIYSIYDNFSNFLYKKNNIV